MSTATTATKTPAKKAATPKPAPKEKAPAKEKAEGFGIKYLSEQLGIEPHQVRVQLRKHEIEKGENNRYFWDRKADADSVVKKVKTAMRESPAKKSDEE
jgi:hypothetical protein